MYQLNPTDKLPAGFAGKVVDIVKENEIRIYCEYADFDEMFEQICWSAESTVFISMENEAERKKSSSMKRSASLSFPILTAEVKYPDLISGALEMTDELRDIPAGPAQPSIEGKISVSPQVHCRTAYFLIPFSRDSVFKCRQLFTKVNADVTGSIRGRKAGDISRTVNTHNALKFEMPLGFGETATLSYTGSMTVQGNIGVDYEFSGGVSTSVLTNIVYNDSSWHSPICTFYKHSQPVITRSIDAVMDKSISLSGAISISLVQSGDTLKSVTQSHIYSESLSGDSFYKISEIQDSCFTNNLYKRLTENGVTAKTSETVSARAMIMNFTESEKHTFVLDPETTFYVVPKFTDPIYDRSEGMMHYKVSGSSMKFSDSKLGLAIRDKSGLSFVHSGLSWPEKCKSSFDCKVPEDYNGTDLIYPTVTLTGGSEILASPVYPILVYTLFPRIASLSKDGYKLTLGAKEFTDKPLISNSEEFIVGKVSDSQNNASIE